MRDDYEPFRESLRAESERQRDWAWSLGAVGVVVLLGVMAWLMSSCGAVSSVVDRLPEVADDVETALEIHQCVEAAVAKRTQRETKRLLERRPIYTDLYEADGGVQ